MRNEAVARNQPEQAAGAHLPPHILLAEDDHELRVMLASELRRQGFDVVEARNGRELLENVGSALLGDGDDLGFDLIISDIRMPGPTGIEILSGLERGGIKTPILLMTAFGDQQTEIAARRLGAVGVLNKPFDLDEFLTLVLQSLWDKMDSLATAAGLRSE